MKNFLHGNKFADIIVIAVIAFIGFTFMNFLKTGQAMSQKPLFSALGAGQSKPQQS